MVVVGESPAVFHDIMIEKGVVLKVQLVVVVGNMYSMYVALTAMGIKQIWMDELVFFVGSICNKRKNRGSVAGFILVTLCFCGRDGGGGEFI